MRKSHVNKNVNKEYKTVWFVLGFSPSKVKQTNRSYPVTYAASK